MVDVTAGGQQAFQHGQVVVLRRDVEWRPPILRRLIRISAGGQQALRHGQAALLHRYMQRRPAILREGKRRCS